ncbi:MAG: DMT family transporter, partial [Planctomycetota bacterium]
WIGDLFALSAAVCWAVGSLLFSRVRVSAAGINLFKNVLSGLLLLVLVLVMEGSEAPLLLDLEAWGWLGLSSLAGLVIGDTCHFRSLQILGARRCVVLETLAPPLAGLCGWFFLAEVPSAWVWIGMAITLSGVVMVILERTSGAEAPGHFPGSTALGVLMGVSAALCQALGAAWSKKGIQRFEGLDVSEHLCALDASCVRLLVAVMLGIVLGLYRGRLRGWTAQVRTPGTMRVLIPASITGTFLGVSLSMLAFQYTSLAEANTLGSTSPIFVLPLVIWFLKQRVSLVAFLGAVLAVVGVAILFWR